MKTVPLLVALAGVLALGHTAHLYGGEPSKRPNIILVMADDQGWGDTSYNGHPQLKTPTVTVYRYTITWEQVQQAISAAATNISPERAARRILRTQEQSVINELRSTGQRLLNRINAVRLAFCTFFGDQMRTSCR
jgi:hypothetical protein